MEVKEPSAKYLARIGHKQTEAGVIPEDWEVKPLRSLADRIMVGIASAATHAYRDRGIVMFRNQNIKPGYLDDSDLLYIAEEYEQTFRNKRLKAGDLLTARTGYPGTTSIVPKQYEGAQSFTTLITRPRSDIVDSEYLCIFINSEAGQSYFEQNQIGGGQKNVNAGSLKNLPVAFPPTKAEQGAIAEALRDVDALIESLEQLLVKRRHLKQGAMHELLTGKKRLPGFGGEWETKRLGDVIERFVGGGTPNRAIPQYWGNDIPWATVKDFATFNPRQSQEAITRVGLQNSASHLIPKGTLITSTRMALGKAVIYEVDVAINQDLKALFPKPDLATQYLYFWFQYHGQSIDDLGSGSTVKGVSLPDLKKIEFQIPTLPEQTAVGAVLSDMDAEITALEIKLGKACQIKQGMMQELLTGRIRLVQPKTNVVQLPLKKDAAPEAIKSHNWQINEAVVISVLTKHFGSERFPLGRKRCTKLSYLLHRHVEHLADGYLKKAAGPYNPAVKYKGPEGIAQKNRYVRPCRSGQYTGFIAGENIAQAEAYFAKWYGDEPLTWLEQFRRKTNDELELLATVDMALVDLRNANKSEQLANVKKVIRDHPEWEAKLDRAIFSDDKITRAMKSCQQLFGAEG